MNEIHYKDMYRSKKQMKEDEEKEKEVFEQMREEGDDDYLN